MAGMAVVSNRLDSTRGSNSHLVDSVQPGTRSYGALEAQAPSLNANKTRLVEDRTSVLESKECDDFSFVTALKTCACVLGTLGVQTVTPLIMPPIQLGAWVYENWDQQDVALAEPCAGQPDHKGHANTGDPAFDDLWNHPGPRLDVGHPSSRQVTVEDPNNPFRGLTSKSLKGLLSDAGYVAGRHLGHGAYGSVHVYTNGKGESFAVKELDKGRVLDPDKSKWFGANVGPSGMMTRGEALALNLTEHPHVLKTYGLILYNEQTGDYRVVTDAKEFKSEDEEHEVVLGTLTQVIPGSCELGKHVPSGVGLPFKDVRKIARQLVLALAYLHEKGMIHRDVKPENILYDPATEQVYLIDFGFVFNLNVTEGGRTKTRCGTPAYKSPELFRRCIYGKEVDVWALGVTLYFMKYGKVPFGDGGQIQFFGRSSLPFSSFMGLRESVEGDEKRIFLDLLDQLIAPRGKFIPPDRRRITMDQALQHPFFAEE